VVNSSARDGVKTREPLLKLIPVAINFRKVIALQHWAAKGQKLA
jgi:hypothetical protein